MEVGDGQPFHEPEGIGEGRFRLAGKPGYDIDPDGDVGIGRMDFLNEIPEEGRIVVPVHGGQDPVIPALQGDVEVTADDAG